MKYSETPDIYRDSSSKQTQPIQHFEADKNTNLGSNIFTQTQPIQHFEATTNTNLANNIFLQTHPMQTFEASTLFCCCH